MEKSKEIEKVYSEKIRAGKRSYFFDIKPTKSKDYYLVITEKKWNNNDGTSEKHRIFLYKEDLNKFSKAMKNAFDHIKKELLPNYNFSKYDRDEYKDEENKE